MSLLSIRIRFSGTGSCKIHVVVELSTIGWKI